MGTQDFYRELVPLASFRDVASPSAYIAAPDDWFIIITDVRGSTKAIEAGRYKEVNVLGAASIITVLNACSDRDLPFVFGGDGATLLLTANELDRATGALLGLAATAKRVFEMELRVGVVPVADVLAAGHDVRVAKLALSDVIELAMFSGTGMGYAEELVKGADTAARYTLVPTDAAAHPDVTGLECRWQPIGSRNGHMVSIIVLARTEGADQRAATYVAVLDEFERIAPSIGDVRPVRESGMQLAATPAAYEPETRIRTGETGGLSHFAHKTWARVESTVGRFLMGRGAAFAGFDGAAYPEVLVAHTDYRKFDDTLRMVVDLSDAQQAEFVAFLEARREAGELFYGIHEASAAMMTCLVWDRDRDHLHFIDGADGGYALAAKQLKDQIRQSS